MGSAEAAQRLVQTRVDTLPDFLDAQGEREGRGCQVGKRRVGLEGERARAHKHLLSRDGRCGEACCHAGRRQGVCEKERRMFLCVCGVRVYVCERA